MPAMDVQIGTAVRMRRVGERPTVLRPVVAAIPESGTVAIPREPEIVTRLRLLPSDHFSVILREGTAIAPHGGARLAREICVDIVERLTVFVRGRPHRAFDIRRNECVEIDSVHPCLPSDPA